MAEKEISFQKLTPKQNIEDLKYYEEALDFALSEKNPDIKNIAITGIYGSGKSSILESYKNKKDSNRPILKEKFMHISLADYKDKDQGKSENQRENTGNEELDNKTLEGKILNQLLHQIDPENIPQSIFQLKNNVSIEQVLLPTLFILAFILNVFYLWNNPINRYNEYLLVIQLGFLLYSLIKMQFNKKILKNISIRSNNIQSDIEIFKDSEDSYFDKYLDDVIYLFYNSGADVVVFEDIDRFDNHIIFAKLKEINTLINNKKDNKIIFVYMIKDDMFQYKDRTKFFDFILPIIPHINSSNSYDELKKILESLPQLKKENNINKVDNTEEVIGQKKIKEECNDEGNTLYHLFDNYFLLKLSVYIDDMRMLKNIVNELIIYYGRLSSLNLDINKFLAMITYKNIFPNDFAKLQLNRGFVYQLFDNKNDYIKHKKEKLENKIKKLEGLIEESEEEQLESKYELYALYFKWIGDYEKIRVNNKDYRKFSDDSSFIKEVINNNNIIEGRRIGYGGYSKLDLSEEIERIESKSGFQERIQIVENKGKIENFQEEIKTKKNKIEWLEEKRVYEVINLDDIEKNKEEFQFINNNLYFDLLVFLIMNGYIDEDYHLYISYFYENSLTIEDQEFLRGVYVDQHFGYDYELTNLGEIVNRLEPRDYKVEAILNSTLFEYVLTEKKLKNRIEILSNFFIQIITNDNSNFYLKIFIAHEEYRKEMLNQLIQNTPALFDLIIQNPINTESDKVILILEALSIYDESELQWIENENKLIIDFIERTELLLLTRDKYSDQFKDNLKYWNIKFNKVFFEKLETTFADFLYANCLYKINYKNVRNILFHYYECKNEEDICHRNYTLIYMTEDSHIKDYIEENIELYLEKYLEFSEGKIMDEIKHVYKILNNEEIIFSLKFRYINSLCQQKLVLSEVEHEELYSLLLTENKLEPNSENIKKYFKFNKNEWSEELIEFVNENKTQLVFNWDNNDEELEKKLFNRTVKENQLENQVYEDILKDTKRSFEKFAFEDISEDKVRILINLNLIRLTTESLSNVRKNYPNVLNYFISKNIDSYLKLVKESKVYDYEELLNVLKYRRREPVRKKYQIIDVIKEPISVINNEFQTHVMIYVFKNNFDLDDLPYLVSNYGEYNKTMQDVIFDISIKEFAYLIQEEVKIDLNLLYLLVNNEQLALEDRQLIFSRNIKNIEKKKLKEIFEILSLDEYITVVNEHRIKMPFEETEINKNILKNLEMRDLISSMPKENGYYNVNSKTEKKFNLNYWIYWLNRRS